MMELPTLEHSAMSPRGMFHIHEHVETIKPTPYLQVNDMMGELHATQPSYDGIKCMEWDDNFNPRNAYFPRQRLAKIGTMYVLVKSEMPDDNSYNNLHSNNLPGAVPNITSVYHRDFTKLDIKSGIFNARMHLHATGIDQSLHRKIYEVNTLMRKFMIKLMQAIKTEDDYFVYLHNHFKFGLKKSECSQLHLPKLGKVYAEFVKCMRAVHEVTRLWKSEKVHFPANLVYKLNDLISHKVIYAQDRTLQLTRSLILKRLENIGELSSLFTMNGLDHFESAFLVTDLKRFCKLIEVFNHFVSMMSKTFQHKQHFCKVNIQAQANNINIVDTVEAITIENVLMSLSEPASKCLTMLFSQIFSEFVHEIHKVNKQFLWTDLLKIKIRTIQLSETDFTNVANIVKGMGALKIPFPASLFNDEENEVSRMLRCQKQFLISFFSTFASSSSLLRKTLLSHNSQVMRCTPSPIDDTASIISSEDGSNMYSSAIRKSVVWRDSWDMDSVMTVSNRCLHAISQVFPLYITKHVETSDYIHALHNPNIHIRVPSKCYWTDVNTASLEICIFNLSNFHILPDTIVKSANESIGSIVISKIISYCDRMLGDSLAYSQLNKTKKVENVLRLESNTYLLLQVIQALLVTLTKYQGHVEIAHQVLPKLEVALNFAFSWIQKQMDVYIAKAEIELLLNICLRDLRDITENSLDCLQQVENCHNAIESKRSNHLAGLHVATIHLKNIDHKITDMQELTTSCLKKYAALVTKFCKELLKHMFPSSKEWARVQANNEPSGYVTSIISNFFEPSCKAVKGLDLQSQISVAPCAANCVFECILDYIKEKKIKFNTAGAKQLKFDFESLMDYLLSENAHLLRDAHESLKMLRNVKQAFHVVHLLSSSEHVDDVLGAHNGSQASFGFDSLDEAHKDDKVWLLLRSHVPYKTGKTAWKLPCMR